MFMNRFALICGKGLGRKKTCKAAYEHVLNYIMDIAPRHNKWYVLSKKTIGEP